MEHNKPEYQSESTAEREIFVKSADVTEACENKETANISQEAKRRWQCVLCSKRFLTKNRFNLHVRLHTTNPHKCPTCGKAFRTNRYLRCHLTTYSDAKPFVCVYCREGFPTRKRLRLHILVHTNERPYKCKTCRAKFKRHGNLQSHLFTHSDVRYSCKKCNIKFLTAPNLHRHLQMFHSSGNFYRKCKCKICDVSFKTIYELRRHNIESHARKKPREKPFDCEKCTYTFSTFSRLTAHIRRKHSVNWKQFDCELCDEKFYSRRLLYKHNIQHVNSAVEDGTSIRGTSSGITTENNRTCQEGRAFFHPIKPNRNRKRWRRLRFSNKCILCGVQFSDPVMYQEHRYTHLLYSKKEVLDAVAKDHFACKVCSKDFSGLNNLYAHMANHMEKSHRCEACDKMFSYGNLMKHNRVNHQRIECDVCDLVVYGIEKLRKHQEKLHSGLNDTFSCEVCNKNFYRRITLLRHMAREHEKDYKCDFCAKVMYTKSWFAQHVFSCSQEHQVTECNICGKKFSTKLQCSRHFLCHLVKEEYRCEECSKVFKLKHSYEEHVAKNACRKKTSTFECRLCRETVQIRSVVTHSRICSSFLKCRFCGSKYSKVDMMKRHMKNAHGDADVYYCGFCEVTFKEQTELVEHYKTEEHRNVVLVGPNEGTFKSEEEVEEMEEVTVKMENAEDDGLEVRYHDYKDEEQMCKDNGVPGTNWAVNPMENDGQGTSMYYCGFCDIRVKYSELEEHYQTDEHRNHSHSNQIVKTETMEEIKKERDEYDVEGGCNQEGMCGENSEINTHFDAISSEDKNLLPNTEIGTAHKGSQVNNSVPTYDCPLCKKDIQLLCLDFHSRSCYSYRKCRFCGQEYKKMSLMKTHMNRVHNRANAYYCEFCDASFKEYWDIIKHYKTDEHRNSVLGSRIDQNVELEEDSAEINVKMEEIVETHSQQLSDEEDCLKTKPAENLLHQFQYQFIPFTNNLDDIPSK